MDRKKQQNELIYKLGLLLGPLQNIVDNPEGHDRHSRTRAGGKFFADTSKFESDIKQFATSDPGHIYLRELNKTRRAFGELVSCVREHLDDSEVLGPLLKQWSAETIDGILAIPSSPSSLILEAHTPFSTYVVIKDLYQTVSEKLIIVDRYLNVSIFYRYLRDVPASVKVSLVTWPDRTSNLEFMDVSRLYAAERGPDNYRLVVNDHIHDRWLYCDEQIYALGGSFEHAGHTSDLTLSKLEVTQEDLNRIDQLITTGTEIFGPTQTKHP